MDDTQFQIYKASTETREKLIGLPESGMGYQKITTDHCGQYYAFNGEYLVPLSRYNEFLNYIAGHDDILFEDFPLNELKTELDNIQLMHDKLKSSKVTTQTRKHDIFYRFSAFKDDFRIKNNGDFISGTYGTSYSDIRLVPNGLAAVGRYALPNPLSARYVYILLPKENTRIEISTVEPANKQAGGGVEVFSQKEVILNMRHI